MISQAREPPALLSRCFQRDVRPLNRVASTCVVETGRDRLFFRKCSSLLVRKTDIVRRSYHRFSALPLLPLGNFRLANGRQQTT